MNITFRWLGSVVFVIAAICRINAYMIFPGPNSSGAAPWTSQDGVLLSGFSDICTVLMLLGGLAFLFSFTTLVNDYDSPRKESGAEQPQEPA
jgi:hypothetical protein